ncbi:hypothetical protein [Streptomyces sp. NPDC056294]|uniref:hypothetical protein n=1 Tax=Streptomyces sp. NPDC056294 TaxID=3345773 RepID=UPI0035DF2D4C
MAENRNDSLAAWMTARQMSATELADAVNKAIGAFTGRTGVTSERTVFRWLSGESRWPQELQRRGLESVTGLPATALGFVPRGKSMPAPPPEDPDMRRRELLGAAAALPLTSSALSSSAPARPVRVGSGDVIRLRDDVERLVALDAERGGHGLEQAALVGAAEALRLQKGSVTQRVRQRLYALAADYTSTAAWSLIDAGRLDGAGPHLDRALALAGLAQDAEMVLKVWNLQAMLARQRRDYTEAVAAAQAAQATAAARAPRCTPSSPTPAPPSASPTPVRSVPPYGVWGGPTPPSPDLPGSPSTGRPSCTR